MGEGEESAVFFSVKDQPIIPDYPFLPIYATVIYLIFLVAGQRFMQNRQPYDLKWLLAPWNLFLSIGSLVVAVPVLYLIYEVIKEEGLHSLICDEKHLKGWPFFMVYIFAWSKFLELFDTVWLVLRKRPVPFLHWYHHITVMCFTWFCMYIHNRTGWFFSSINAIIHTIMYYYYFIRAVNPGARIWWDKYLTQLQLIQMAVGIAITIYWTVIWLQGTCPSLPDLEWLSKYWLIFALLMYGSYFALFLQFYLGRYNQSSRTNEKQRKKN